MDRLNLVTYEGIAKWWLSGVLLVLPFQLTIAKTQILRGNETLSFIRYLDEITIVAFSFLAMIVFIRKKEIRDGLYLVLLLSLGLLVIIGLISGFINGNSLLITSIGTLDYIRNFLLVFIYGAFFRDLIEVKKIFRLILMIAVVIGVIAFLQELWAVTSHYYFSENSQVELFITLKNILPDYSHYPYRVGIYRVSSLMHNYIFMGLYCLLILSIYMFTQKKISIFVFLALYCAIFGSVSRMVYMGYIVVAGVQIIRTSEKRALMVLSLVPILILMVKLSTLWDLNVLKLTSASVVEENNSFMSESEDTKISFREYSKERAIQIWKDHPLWGVGPGMFGGIISIKYKSYVYDEYNFNSYAQALLNSWKHIDQWWPQMLAETGILGVACFAGTLISVLSICFIARNRTTSDQMKGLFAGYGLFLVIVLLYSLGSVINITQVVFPYFAFIGMGLGCLSKDRINI